MNTSDLTLQMAYLAGQIAQSTLPDIGVSAGRPEQKMDFQALLNEKRTQADRERTEQEPQKTDLSQDTEAGKTEQKDEDVAAQAAGQGVPLMLDLSAVLAGGGIVPFVGCVVVTEQAEQITCLLYTSGFNSVWIRSSSISARCWMVLKMNTRRRSSGSGSRSGGCGKRRRATGA